jgi:hypothetical protein
MKDEVEVAKDSVDFKVIYNKNKYDVNFPLDSTIGQLKQHLQDIIGTAFLFHTNASIVPEISPHSLLLQSFQFLVHHPLLNLSY